MDNMPARLGSASMSIISDALYEPAFGKVKMMRFSGENAGWPGCGAFLGTSRPNHASAGNSDPCRCRVPD